MRTTSFLAGAMCGGLVGAVAALFLAPMTGEDFRGRVKSELEHVVAEARRAASEQRIALRAQVDGIETYQEDH